MSWGQFQKPLGVGHKRSALGAKQFLKSTPAFTFAQPDKTVSKHLSLDFSEA